MATEYITACGRDHSDEDLDRALDALAHSHRRAIIEELERDEPLAVDEIAGRIAERDHGVSATEAKLELVHRHVPKLEDEGVIACDEHDDQCRLKEATTVRSVLASLPPSR